MDNEINELYQNSSILRIKRDIGDPQFHCNAHTPINTIIVSTQVSGVDGLVAVYKSMYDSTKRVPLFTSYVFDQQNYLSRQGSFTKSCTFLVFENCKNGITLNVPKSSEYCKSGYSRGHLMPWADWRNLDPSSTQYLLNYFINAAPQVNYFNYVTWSRIEAEVRNRLIDKGPGVVATGLCFSNSNTKIGPNKDITVPSCYWKFVCYQENDVPIVYGYFGENNNNQSVQLQILTPAQMLNQPGVQDSLLKILHSNTFDWNRIWEIFFHGITNNRNPGVTLNQCATASQTPSSTRSICGKRKRNNGSRRKRASMCDISCPDCECNPSCDSNPCPSSMACIQDSDDNMECVPFCNQTNPDAGPANFLLYTRKNQFVPIDITDISSGILPTNFNPSVPTKFLTHGFTDSGKANWIQQMKNTYLQNYDINVIIVDWNNAASNGITKTNCWLNLFYLEKFLYGIAYTIYGCGAHNTIAVGESIASMVNTLKLDPSLVHCIGHSLGSHVCGFFGKNYQITNPGKKISRITGLDPAGPAFTIPIDLGCSNRLCKTDASYVDVIHTNGGFLGVFMSIGTVDYFPNEGSVQNGCGLFTNPIAWVSFTGWLTACSHNRAPLLFTASIGKSICFPSFDCSLAATSASLASYFCKYKGPMGDLSNGQSGDLYLWAQDNPYCTCPENKYITTLGCSSCPSAGASPNSNCPCGQCSNGLICSSGTCTCPSNSYWSGSSCVSCPSAGAIPQSNCPCGQCSNGLVCSSGTCTCPTNTYWSGSSCVSCPSAGAIPQSKCPCGQCLNGLICSSGTCTCPTNTYWTGSSCVSCPVPGFKPKNKCPCGQCLHGLICSEGTCTCPRQMYWFNAFCVSCPSAGAIPQSNCPCDQCLNGLICSSGTCTCPTNTYWTGSSCVSCPDAGRIPQSKCSPCGPCFNGLICSFGTCKCTRFTKWNGSACSIVY